MTLGDPYVIVRAASLYISLVVLAGAVVWRRPTARAVAGATLASLWNVPVLLALHLAAARWGWWRFDAEGGLLLGMPVDLFLSWVVLWGAVPAIACPSLPLTRVLALALAIDVVLMPAAAPVVDLGPSWLAGEFAGLLLGLLPGQLLARWTARQQRLPERALLQMIAFTGLLIFVMPAAIIDGSGGGWANPFERPLWQISLIAQALAVPAVLGLSAVHEFVTRGGGTPVPFDAPRRLVTSGVYAYVRNPMQLSGALVLLVLGLVLRNGWVAAAGVMAHLYSIGLAGWNEDEDLQRRFGTDWIAYRRGVRRWIPRLAPWHPPDGPDARLFVSEECGMCREVGRWFQDRGARRLSIVPAESHPSGGIRRMTYEPGDGAPAASGIEAAARALEHVHFGWAYLGSLLRLPVVRHAAQLLADASGGGPRPIRARPIAPSCPEK